MSRAGNLSPLTGGGARVLVPLGTPIVLALSETVHSMGSRFGTTARTMKASGIPLSSGAAAELHMGSRLCLIIKNLDGESNILPADASKWTLIFRPDS